LFHLATIPVTVLVFPCADHHQLTGFIQRKQGSKKRAYYQYACKIDVKARNLTRSLTGQWRRLWRPTTRLRKIWQGGCWMHWRTEV